MREPNDTERADAERDGSTTHTLVVDDDETVRRTLQRLLQAHGFTVTTAASGAEALEALDAKRFDVVLTDISMPGMDGVELLEQIRRREPDLPVILATGLPTLSSAKRAVALGAFQYLEKPFRPDELLSEVRQAANMRRVAQLKSIALQLAGMGDGNGVDLADLERTFQRSLDALWMAYQPIVSATNGLVRGYETLLRSAEPRLSNPARILGAAERLGRVLDLGRHVRRLATVPWLDGRARGDLFVNLHPRELADPRLLNADTPLSRIAPQVVLEVTERSSLEGIPDLQLRVVRLRELGFRLAVDDLGSGYAGLNSFAKLRPEFVKLDMELVRDVDRNDLKQRLIRSMTEACRDLGIRTIAEGVETQAEHEKLIELGAELLQGYYYGRPAPFEETLAG